MTDKDGQPVKRQNMVIDSEKNIVRIEGDFKEGAVADSVSFGNMKQVAKMSWEWKDRLYGYDGELGARLSEQGDSVDLNLWSPSADKVRVVVYDKDDQSKELGRFDLHKGESGVWQMTLNQEVLNLSDFTGYYYLYEITRENHTVLALDPYAKSLAEWDSSKATDSLYVAKGAFVNPSKLGPKDLTYATIDHFNDREDAIIYEAHVRDFTSDTTIAPELRHTFGTFAAFVERLDYLQKLGVTHIQLLPILSYYFVNESDKERASGYDSKDQNYNWGYDPQSYFALSGMYSENPSDPEQRIVEFKNLVKAIHDRKMGVILDVVYNHTAKTQIFEALEPNYYHFMTADGTAKESFGGGRLGTTHKMSRRVLVDSIKYLVDEYKVDGFRFDMMGDHDAETIETAYKAAKHLNPNIIMIGEGWLTYQGDDNKPQQAADQTWMKSTDTVGVFSDDIRNSLKSGYPNEGTPAFLTGGRQNIVRLFNNIKAQPNNFVSDDPGDVVQYIEAHDNLTLHDAIAYSLKKDPAKDEEDIHKRIRIGNALLLTSQGTAFIHSGQEYGRTKQLLNEDYRSKVTDTPSNTTYNEGVDKYPYFVDDSYDSSDGVNHFDWEKATNPTAHPITVQTQAYTAGLIQLRRSTDAFRQKTKEAVDHNVSLITKPNDGNVGEYDLLIAYQVVDSKGETYAVILNADQKERTLTLPEEYRQLLQADVIVDQEKAGIVTIKQPKGIVIDEENSRISIEALTAIVLRVAKI